MADKFWNGSVGTWSTATSWSGNTIPASGDNVFISAGTLTINTIARTCLSLTVGGTCTITGTTLALNVTGNMAINSGTFTYSSGGALNVGGSLSTATGTTFLYSGAGALPVTGTITNAGTFTHSGASALSVAIGFNNTGTYNQTNASGSLSFTGAIVAAVNWGTNNVNRVIISKTSNTSAAAITFNGTLNCQQTNTTASGLTFTSGYLIQNGTINTRTLTNSSTTARTWEMKADVNLTGSFSGAIVTASQTTCTYASKTGTIRFQNTGSTTADSTLAFGSGVLATCPNVSIETANTTTRVLVTGSVENLWTSGTYVSTGNLTVFGSLQDNTANCSWTGATITKPATASGATSTTNCTARFGVITFAGGATAATTFNSACTHTVTFCRASTIAISTTALGVTYNFNDIEVATALNLSLPTNPSTPCTVRVYKARPFSGAGAVTTTIGQAATSTTTQSTVYLEDYDIPSTIIHNTQYLIIGGLNSNSVRCTNFTTGSLTRYFDIGSAGRTSYLVTKSNQTGEPGTGSCSISGTGFNNSWCNGGFVVAGSGSHSFGTPTWINALIVILRSGSASLSGTIARLEVEASGGATGTITINGPYAGDSIKQISGNPGPISGLNLIYALSTTADTPDYTHNFAGILGTITVNSTYSLSFDNVNCTTLTIAGSGTALSSDVTIAAGNVDTLNFQPAQTGTTATSNCTITGGTFGNFNVNYTTTANKTLTISTAQTANLVTGTLTHSAGTIYLYDTVAVQNYTATATNIKQIDWSSNSASTLKINGNCTLTSILTFSAAGETNNITGSAYAGSFWLNSRSSGDTYTGYVWTATVPAVRYNTIFNVSNSNLANWYTQNCTFIEDANCSFPSIGTLYYTDAILGSNTLSTNLSGLTLQSVLVPRDTTTANITIDCKTTVPFAAFNHNTVNTTGLEIANIYANLITLNGVGTFYIMGATSTDIVKSDGTITLSAAATYNMYYVECVNLTLNGTGATYNVDGVRYVGGNLNPTTGTITHTAGTLNLSNTGSGYSPVLSACNFTSNTGTRTINFKDNSSAFIQTLGTGALNISYSGLTTIFQAEYTPFAGFLHNSTGSITTGAVAPTAASAASIYILKGCTLPTTLYVKNFSNFNYAKFITNDLTTNGSGYPTNTSTFTIQLYGDFSIGGDLLESQTGPDTVANRAGWQYLNINLATTASTAEHSLTTQARIIPSPYTYSYPMNNISTIPQITLPNTFQGQATIIGRLQCNNFIHERGTVAFSKNYNYDTSGTYSSGLYVNTKISSLDTVETKTQTYTNNTTSGDSTSIYLLATTGTVWDFPKTDLLNSTWQIVVNVLGGTINHGVTTRSTSVQPSFDFTNFTSSYTINPNTSFNVGSLFLKNYNIPNSSVFNIGGPAFTYNSPSNTIGTGAAINLINGGNRTASGTLTAISFTGTTGQLSYSNITNVVAQIGQLVQISGAFFNSAFNYISNTITNQSVNNGIISVQGATSGTPSGSTFVSGFLALSNAGSVQRPYASASATIQYTVSNSCRITYSLNNNGAVNSTPYSSISISTSLGFYVSDSIVRTSKTNIVVDIPGSSSNYTITINANTGISGQEAITGNVNWSIGNSSTAITGNISGYNGTSGQYTIIAVSGTSGITLSNTNNTAITTVTGTIQGPTFAISSVSAAPAGSDTTVFTSNTTAIYPSISCGINTNLKLSSNNFNFNRLNLSNGCLFDAYTNTSTYGLTCNDAIIATQNSTLNITGKTLEIRGANNSTTSGIQFGSNGATNTDTTGNLIGSTSSNLLFSGLNGTGGGNQYVRFSKYSATYGGKLTNNLQYNNASTSGFLYIELEGLNGVASSVYPAHFFDISFGYSTGALQINSYYGVGLKTFNLINGIRLNGVNATYSASNNSMVLANSPASRVAADQLIINNFNVTGGNGWYYGNNSTVSGSYTGWQNGLPPTFSLNRTPASGNINEGSTITITLNTTNLNNGSVVPFTISGVDSTDILINGVSTLTGNFTMSGNSTAATASITVTAVADFTDESLSGFQFETTTLNLNNGAASISFAIFDTSKVPTYSLSRSPAGDITEGNSVTITLTATSIPVGYQIPYTLSGTATNGTDYTLSSTSGYFTLGATTVTNDVLSATSTLTFNTVWDYVSESTETVTLTTTSTYPGTNASITFNILNLLHPTYALSASPTSVQEGGNFTITLTTTDVTNGTNIPYTISGTDITASDFSIGGSSSFTGNFNIQSNTSTITVTTLADYFSESTENFRLTLDTIGTLIDIPITDYYKTRTWSLATNKTTVTEGESFIITLTTTNVFDNTLVPYTISSGTSGAITTGDFTPASLTGNFTVVGNTAQQTFTVISDGAIEGIEIFVLTLGSPANGSINITIRDAVASAGNFLILFE